MPFYRYVCDNCGSEKSVFHSIHDVKEVRCEMCGEQMKKAISRVGVVFKGSGFYCTDTKNGSSTEDNFKNKTCEKKDESAA